MKGYTKYHFEVCKLINGVDLLMCFILIRYIRIVLFIFVHSGENGITEEAVRRYLMRKPMTTTELLQKFKGRKTGLSSEQLVNVMTQILKRINPIRQTIKNKMYLSIKPQPQQ